ncbi:MAG TPA: zinc-binding dehydrogenase [Methylomirabilota bacterium]|jgi:threonine dehydrogenase-like Zn-dependent dehydrogenase|nr:zinc-binding dehydrogenase [Methylomirabilota bacterium]
MHVATWHGDSRFTLDDVPEPTPGPGQVLIGIHTAGICGSDVHATQGLFPLSAPRVMGHEYSGTVLAAGRGISRSLVGRAVACEPNYGCGACGACRDGRISQCQEAVRVGGFAERVVLPRHCVHALPEGLDPATAALAEPAACCLEGLEMARLRRGASVVVIGGGIMGLLTLALAKARGAGTAILSDPVLSRREAAGRLGADITVDPTADNLAQVVDRATGGRGVDLACEAVGKPELLAAAARLVRPRGVVQLVGVCPKGSTLPVDLFDFHFRELTLTGAYGRGTAFRRVLPLLTRIGAGSLVTDRYPLERIADAFAHAAAGRGLKTAITPGAASPRSHA